MAVKEMTNAEMVSVLQNAGVEVNPNAKKSDLLKQMHALQARNLQDKDTKELLDNGFKTTPQTDMEKLMGMMSQVINKVDAIDKRVTSVETNGKGDFKLSVKQEDVDKASANKKNLDARIVSIVEDILGVDFGIEIIPNPNGPGFQFSVLVPERLSEVKRSRRPIRDEVTGDYKLDEKKRVIEEEYWPGDKRSRAIGSTDSFDVIRDQCNRVRAYIISYYDKNKKPVPEFRLR